MNSPFLDEALFVADEPRVAAFVAESPFAAALEFVERETGVIGPDDRKPVTPTTGVPWRWICKIDVKGKLASQPGQGPGTGVLISRRHVLTAAHVVFEAAQNMQNFSIEVTPALDYGSQPFGSYAVTTKPRLSPDYRPDVNDPHHLDFDFALLTLDTAVGDETFKALGGKALCFWASPTCGANSVFARRVPAALDRKAVSTAGYPDSAGGKRMMGATGTLYGVTRLSRTMGCSADTTKGQSGSPIWLTQGRVPCLVGIAVGASQGMNTALRVTVELIRQLRAWITADGETPAMTEREAASEGREAPSSQQWLEAEQGGVAPWAAAIDPFPPEATLAFLTKDRRMMRAFEPVTVSTASHLGAALVDLTGSPSMPPYAGLHDNEMVFAGSLPKICVMYAAFALRARVQAFVDAAVANGAPVVLPQIAREIEKAWRPTLRGLFPTRPVKSFGTGQDTTFPKLEQIFTFSPDGKVDFARATPALTNADLDALEGSTSPEFKTPLGKFHDWMRLMQRWSNNTAASRCILALGYFYLNGALGRAGLFDAASRNGLWLSADYLGHDWVKTALEQRTNAAGPLLTPRWASAQGRRRSNVTATAAQVARFMTLLAQGKLVDAAASSEMRALLDKTHGGIVSYARSALHAVGRRSTAFASKIGYGDDRFSHDCALIERSVGGKTLRYVAVGLGSAPSRQRADLRDLFVLLDETIVQRNT
jgi:V8-like Glu-specific endopeptidase